MIEDKTVIIFQQISSFPETAHSAISKTRSVDTPG